MLEHVKCLVDSMMRHIGQTVTIFTTSGGLSGSGFTGVLLSVDCNCVRLLADIGAPPACPIGSACCNDMTPMGIVDNEEGFFWGGNPLGAVCVIPRAANIYTQLNYMISNYGRCYSKHSGRLLTPRIKKHKRIGIKLYVDGKDRYFFAHRLVAFAFSLHNPDPDNFRIINHIDENPQNNKLDNLEWCDDKYNLNYRDAQKRKVLNRNKRIRQYDNKMNLIAEYINMNEASRQTGIHL